MGNESVFDRQDLLPGFSTEILRQSRVLLVGAGGLGGQIAGPLVRKGIGELDILDPDVVEISNLARQPYYAADLWKPKALRLAEHAAGEGHSGCRVTGHHIGFSESIAAQFGQMPDLAIVAVDSNATRAFASRFFRERGVPIVFVAVNLDANYCWVFSQEAGDECPCIGCVFPRIWEAGKERQRCQPVPSSINVLKVAGGLVLQAIDRILMGQPRDWNFHSVHLAGTTPGVIDVVTRRVQCRLCGPTTLVVEGFGNEARRREQP